MNKRLNRFLLLVLMTICHTLNGEDKLVIVGAFDDYPLIFRDKAGNMAGVYVDILKEIGKVEKIRFEYVFGSWQQGLERIKTGEVDLLTDMGYLPERAEFMDYCKVPVMTFWGELYVGRNSEIKGILDVGGKKTGVLRGDLFGLKFKELLANFAIRTKIVEFDSYADIFKAIADKRIDAGVAAGSFKSLEQKKYNLRSTGFVFSPLDVFFTTAKGKNQDLRAVIEKNLCTWKKQQNSAFSRSKKRWLYSGCELEERSEHLIEILVILAVILLSAVGFIVLLKRKVKQVTAEIRKTEDALLKSKIQYEKLVTKIPIGIYILHSQKDQSSTLDYVSPKMAEMLSTSAEIILKDYRQTYKLIHADDRSEFIRLNDECIREKRTFDWQGRFIIDENIKWLHFRSIPELMRNLDVLWYGTVVDISEKKQHEAEIAKLQTFLPICASCKSIRNDEGYWNQIETYFEQHSDVTLSHSICPDCAKKLYPDLYDDCGERKKKKK